MNYREIYLNELRRKRNKRTKPRATIINKIISKPKLPANNEIDNKGRWYKYIINRGDSALDNGYYWEAISIYYSLIEDRLNSIVLKIYKKTRASHPAYRIFENEIKNGFSYGVNKKIICIEELLTEPHYGNLLKHYFKISSVSTNNKYSILDNIDKKNNISASAPGKANYEACVDGILASVREWGQKYRNALQHGMGDPKEYYNKHNSVYPYQDFKQCAQDGKKVLRELTAAVAGLKKKL
ncbi:hypothetical protein [Paenibacillus sp. FJAT-27812]|uniref:hypothetical protein n=1 Tax=Paenibacillus sp. FJAT-27812 TaxID=1684143 RepID=UPI0006A77233|nr:hypothetical protein [Paenibacillus sp. FJAT-27812]